MTIERKGITTGRWPNYLSEITERRDYFRSRITYDRDGLGSKVTMSIPNDRVGRGSKTIPSGSRLVVESTDPVALNEVIQRAYRSNAYVDRLNDTTVVVRF